MGVAKTLGGIIRLIFKALLKMRWRRETEVRSFSRRGSRFAWESFETREEGYGMYILRGKSLKLSHLQKQLPCEKT
jgi:hypothetical protein